MSTTHPELPAEQAYVDHAYACLEHMRTQVERVGQAVDAPEYQAAWFEAYARRRLATFEDADRGLCFGRLDLDGVDASLYVGRRWVHEDDAPLVVNWQAPAARPFYTATVAEPLGVTLRRRFRAEGRRLLDLYDEPLDGSAGEIVHGVADILLEELERSRDERMRDIVATIQSDQYSLITREPEGLFIVQGGPGTGKTAVGLHRASWLLYTYRRELERAGVLVVGPNPVFMDYISHVLPMLGEERVEQRAIDELAGDVKISRHDAPDVARRKGDVAMANVLADAVRALPSPPGEMVGIRVDGAFLYLEPGDIAKLIDEAQASSGSHADGRERLRMLAARNLYEQYGRKLDDLAFRSFDELQGALRTFLAKLVDRAWPRPKPEQLLRRVLAAEGLGGRGWSDGDLPLLDEARALLDGPPEPHGHVIVDEAQDLTPMQLRMLARRTTGAMTILGDIAQAAGPIAYHRWEELLPHVADGREVAIAELRLAYRVPRQVMELAPATAAADRSGRRTAGRVPRRRRAAAFRPGRRRRARGSGRARGRGRSGTRRSSRADRAGAAPPRAPARRRDRVRRARGPVPDADAARGQGTRVRPGRSCRARRDRRRGRADRRPAGTLRRAHTGDEDTGRRPRASAASRVASSGLTRTTSRPTSTRSRARTSHDTASSKCSA